MFGWRDGDIKITPSLEQFCSKSPFFQNRKDRGHVPSILTIFILCLEIVTKHYLEISLISLPDVYKLH